MPYVGLNIYNSTLYSICFLEVFRWKSAPNLLLFKAFIYAESYIVLIVFVAIS